MGEEMHAVRGTPGGYAVVIPVDPQHEVRVIDWPGGDSLGTLYREIGCRTVDLRAVGDLGFWADDEGALGEDWEANGRAAWLAIVVGGGALLVAGTVVITLAEPDREGATQGLDQVLAWRVAAVVRGAPVYDQRGLTARLREVVDRGPLVMTLDENGFPDGFMA